MAIKLGDYKTGVHNDWCPGCGDFGIVNAIQMSLAEMQIPKHKAAIFSGIGCSGKTSHFINTYGVHTLHGRVLTFAQGAKIANPEMTIIAAGGDGDGLGIGAGHFVAAGRRNVNMTYIIFDNAVYGLTKGQASPTLKLGEQTKSLANPEMTIVAAGGDGDGLGIGAGHFVAAGRRNVNMTYIIFDNAVYGLTKGQASPTLKLGEQTKSLPNPNPNYNVNPIALAISSGFTFVARSYSYDVRQLKDLITAAIKHQGLSFIDVLQPCPTYNDLYTRDWFAGIDQVNEETKKPTPRIYNLAETDYDPVVHYSTIDELNEKLSQALVKSLEWGDKIPTGIFYKNELITPYTKRITDKIPNYLENPAAKQKISKNGKPTTDISKLLDSLRV